MKGTKPGPPEQSLKLRDGHIVCEDFGGTVVRKVEFRRVAAQAVPVGARWWLLGGGSSKMVIAEPR